MSDLYEADVFEWSQHQAALLRQRAAGELVNEAELDWPNIAEEVESVGQNQVDAIESWWFQAFLYDLKAEAWPLSRDEPHWRGEARGFRAQARRKYRRSMRCKLDVPGIYADALEALPDTMDGQPPLPVPQTCPVTLDELLNAATRDDPEPDLETQFTQEQKTAMQAKLEALAADYAADPKKGLNAGYQPEQVRGPGPAEIGRPRQMTDKRSNYAAWLYAVAQKDLSPGTWRIDEGMGDGPGTSSITIL